MENNPETKRSLVYIHGGNGYSKYDSYLERLHTMPIDDPREELPERPQRWTDTFETELGEAFQVIRPQMPGKYNAKYEEWKIWFERHFEFFEPEVILVGWSLGACFLVKYLLENKPSFTVEGLFLIAPVAYRESGVGGEDGGDFTVGRRELSKLAEVTPKIHILHSKDDEVVPFAHAEAYKKALPEATLHSFNTRGHFFVETFPELMEFIRGVGKKPATEGE